MLNNSSAYVNTGPGCTPVLPGPPLYSTLYPREYRLDIAYDMTRFLSERSSMHGFPQNMKVNIAGMNARDFGYNYVYFDPGYTYGVSAVAADSAFYNVYLLRDFIHKGGSCGYPGGCNNVSPEQPQISFTVDYLPAAIYAKLWKNMPEDTNSQSDFDVRLILE